MVSNHWEDGEHPLYEIEQRDQRLAFFHPCVGSPLAAGLLEEVIAFGRKKFVVVGKGVLEKGLTAGKLILVESAIRAEWLSNHYLEPGREIRAQAAIRTVL